MNAIHVVRKRNNARRRPREQGGTQSNDERHTESVRVMLARLSLLTAFAVVTTVAVVAPAFATKTDLASPTEARILDEAIGSRCVPAPAKDVLRAYHQ